MSQRFERVKKIKEKVSSCIYKSAVDLRNDIEMIIDDFWNNDKYMLNDDLYDADLSDLSGLHEELIREVSKIHEEERDDFNLELVENNLDLRKVLSEIRDSKSGHKIYTFNVERDYIFVGDLHSDDYSLKRVLKDALFYEKIVLGHDQILIFNGDYVDRGQSHLKIMERLLLLKYIFSESIFLLRGNHDGGKILEDGSIKLPYGVPKEDDIKMYFPKYLEALMLTNDSLDKSILKSYLDFFESLSYIAFVKLGEEIFMAVHGGLPRPNNKSDRHYDYINSLKDLTDESIVDELDRTMCQNIMWSDPYREGDYREKSGRFHYKKEHVESFMDKFKVSLIIRGHEEANDGYWYALDNSVITIFSSGALDDKGEKTDNSESWYSKINPKILKINSKGKRELL